MTGCNASDNLPEQKTDKGQDVTISWWVFPDFAQEKDTDAAGTYEKKIIAAFEQDHPDIHIELQTIDFNKGPNQIATALKNKKVCDVLLDAPGRIIDYGRNGYLVSLNELFTSEYIKDVANENLLAACKDGKNAYMYPLSSSPFFMAFNRDMLEDAGVLELVHEGWTTEEYTRVVQALRKKGYLSGSFFYNGTGGDQATRTFIANLYSSSITDEELTHYTINDEAGVQGLEYVKEAVDTGALVNGLCVFDNGDQAKIEASKEFIKFVCDDPVWGPKNVIQTGCIPVRISFGSLYLDEHIKTIKKWTQYYGVYYNTIEGYAQMRINWNQMLNSVLQGDMTSQNAVDDFVDRTERDMNQKEDAR